MGKKSKTTTLNTTTANSLAYKGAVNIKVKNKKGKIIKNINIHNFGTSELFRFILYCLSGTFDTRDIPHYVYLINSSGESFVTSTGVPISISRVDTDSDSNYYLSYQTSIPIYTNSVFDGLVIYSANNNKAVNTASALSSADNSTYSMRVDFEEEVSLEVDTTLILTWQLSLQDAADITSGFTDGQIKYIIEMLEAAIEEILNGIVSLIHVVGYVDTYDDLPSSPTSGDTYYVIDTKTFYVWIGDVWLDVGNLEGLSLENYVDINTFNDLASEVSDISDVADEAKKAADDATTSAEKAQQTADEAKKAVEDLESKYSILTAAEAAEICKEIFGE